MLGMNLNACNYFTASPVLADRMKTGGGAGGKFTTAPFDPKTLLPTGAGNLARVIPLDPGTHDYVIRFDGPVSRFVVNGAIKQPVIDATSNGRVTFTATMPDASYGSMVTMVAGGAVKRVELMRAEHEAGYDRFDIFNPDFITRLAPFKGQTIRALEPHCTNADIYPAQRPLVIDPVFQDTSGGYPHEFGAMIANKIGAKNLWTTISHLMLQPQLSDMLHGLFTTAGGLHLTLEPSNEFGWTYHRAWAYAQAAAHYGIASPNVFDMLRYYGFMAGNLANTALNVGGSLSRSASFDVILSAQPGDVPDKALAAILAGWDETRAPRSLIGGFTNGGYVDLNGPITFPKLLSLKAANNVNGVYDLMRSLLPALKARHVAAAKAAAANKMPYRIYEGQGSVFSEAPVILDPVERASFVSWMLPIAHSEQWADIVIQAAKDAIAAGAVDFQIWNFAGVGGPNGFWGVMPHITQPAYPLYGKIIEANAAMAPNPNLSALAAEVASMHGQLDDLAARIAAVT
jgi:hypothetical protein